jgi:hypothetical protein
MHHLNKLDQSMLCIPEDGRIVFEIPLCNLGLNEV